MSVTEKQLLKLIKSGKTRKEISNAIEISYDGLRYYFKKFNIDTDTIKTNHVFKLKLEGKIFSKLTVISRAYTNKTGNVLWNCECECGNKKIIAGISLKKGLTKSCGCLKKRKGKENPKNKGYEEISGSYMYLIKYKANLRGLEYDITPEYIWNIFINQKRKCIFSGQKLIFVSNHRHDKSKQTASLDRIDSSKGYIEGNVQWVHKDINKMKCKFSNKEFYNICKLISENYHS